MTLYADIVLPVARGPFTFVLTTEASEGQLCRVQFGARKHLTGVVWRVHDQKPDFAVKPVEQLLDGVLTEVQMRFWEWLSDYYMCTLGEVMAAALPSALKPQGLSQEEFERDVYKPAVEKYVSMTATDERSLNAAFESLTRAPKQYHALMELVEAGGGEVARMRLKADAATIRALENKGLVHVTQRELHYGELPPLPRKLPVLSPAQKVAYDDIQREFLDKQVVLLHGVTGSGKTEIYIDLIAEQLAAGRNVLYLVPEIAMSSQLVGRMRQWFGARVVTYHSRLGERQRAETYRRVAMAGGGVIVLGVRSSVLLPIGNLGLVVVDEEHDASYKQDDPAPRYNARDAAIVLARMHGTKTLLGSATPSLESYSNAHQGGKYGFVRLDERYGGAVLPRIIISDTMKAVERGERTKHFNKALLDRMKATLNSGRQVMLFQNRRGFAPYIECTACGAVVMCRQCNVTMTYHKADRLLRCHYCGRTHRSPEVCPACGKDALEMRGFGTEKVTEELARLFPQAQIERLDRDTATSARRQETIIRAFERGETDILVGTQMITKGFDFGGVGLVGILNADNLLSYPDFRAAERAFQTITQMAGRGGRRDCPAEVVIQTSQPTNPTIIQAANGDYEGMVHDQLKERAEYLYPPYCRLVEVMLRHRDESVLWAEANRLAAAVRARFGNLVLGPQPPLVDRIRGEYMLMLLVKVERASLFGDVRRQLRELVAAVRKVKVSCNVDPQ